MFSKFIFFLGIVTFIFLSAMVLITSAVFVGAFVWAKIEDRQRKDNVEEKPDSEYWQDYYGE